VAKVVTSVEETLPTSEASLEDEIAEVSASLSTTVTRLRQVGIVGNVVVALLMG
jgi:hypothetical protein